MTNVGTSVICSECGKKLRGVVRVTPGFHVRRHNRPDGTRCRGNWLTDHRIAPTKEARPA